MTVTDAVQRQADTRREAVEIVPQSLGGSALARVLLDGDAARAEQAARWFALAPRGADAWKAAVGARPRMSGWAEALAPAIAATGAAAERLQRVVRANGVIVTTGQQPGLFGGPAYTWWKALSALALADEIERCSGVPTAPLFWAANDDTDFAEASWTVVADADGAHELRLRDAAVAGQMMSDTPLGDVSGALDALERASGSASDASVLRAVRRAYAATATVGSAYLALLRELLEPLGIPVLDAAHPAVTRRAHDLLTRALADSTAISQAARARDAEIIAAAYTPQVVEMPDLSLVFARSPEGKRRVPLAEATQLAGTARAGSLSANVLLRPVVERAILPTVAYVAGPGEIAYFAQSTAVADALGVERPVAVPRWSGVIIEPQIRAILDELSLDIGELADPHAAESRIAREVAPADATRALADLRTALVGASHAIGDAARREDLPLSVEAVGGLGREVGHRVDRFERRLLAAVKRRESDRMRRVARARGAIFPLGKRQERALNLLPLLARQGRGLLDDVLTHARAHARSLIG